MTFLKDIFNNLIGSYQPVIVSLQNGDEIVQYDVMYIASAIAFLIVLWCTLRAIGGILCRR